jgi:preprotein translocase subunit SecD
MLDYARWKYYLVAGVLAVALLYALPNVFGDDYAIQLLQKSKEPVTAAQLTTIEQSLKTGGIPYKSLAIENGNAMLRFGSDADQLRARDYVKDEKNGLAKNYLNAMQYASRAPAWMRAVGLKPMPLGLDLRGGLYLLYQVDVNGAVEQYLNTITQDFQRALKAESITYTDINTIKVDADVPDGVRVLLPAGADPAKVRAAFKKVHSELTCRDANVVEGAAIDCVLTAQQVRERRDFAITSNITTLRNRVNALGVSEPIVQRQGIDRIVVQLPGVQNSAEVKDTLGKVATLEFRLEDPRPIPPSGRAPIGAKIYDHYIDGQLVGKAMLKREVIATGSQLISASYNTGQDGPQVDVTLDSAAGDEMLRTTK